MLIINLTITPRPYPHRTFYKTDRPRPSLGTLRAYSGPAQIRIMLSTRFDSRRIGGSCPKDWSLVAVIITSWYCSVRGRFLLCSLTPPLGIAPRFHALDLQFFTTTIKE